MTVSGENIILGGGLAGLSAAWHSGYPVFESRNKVGGTAASIQENGFVFDLGIHVLQSKNEYFLDLLKKLGVTLKTHTRNGWIYNHKTFFPYPFQVNTSHLPFLMKLKCLFGFAFSLKGSSRASDYADWMKKNFGAGFCDTFLFPYAKKFWCFPPDNMTFDWVGNRVPRPKFSEVLKGAFKNQETELGTHTIFQYPEKKSAGFAAIAQAFMDNLKNVHCGMRATRIDTCKKIVFFNSVEKPVHYKKLISTIPLPELVSLLPDVPSEIISAVKNLKFNSIAAVNIGLNTPELTKKHWIHFPEPDISFFRISFPSNFAKSLVPEGASSIQAEIAYRGQQPDPSAITTLVKKDLTALGIIPPGVEILSENTIFLPYGYVIYNHNREKLVKKIHCYLEQLDIYPCGRYGAWEYLWSDQSVLSGKEIIQKITQEDTAENSIAF